MSVPSSALESHSTVSSSPNGISLATNKSSTSPSADEMEELLLDCRYGDLEAVRSFVEGYGVDALASARDERGNNVLHMCAANGHDDVLAYILSLPHLPPTLLTSSNDSGNTPLHWACVNVQLECAKRLVNFRPSSNDADSRTDEPIPALGPALILARNRAGHTPLGEAELNGWDEGARWLVSVMDLQLASESSSAVEAEDDDGEEVGAEASDEVNDGNAGSRIDTKAEKDAPLETGLARLRVSEETFKPQS